MMTNLQTTKALQRARGVADLAFDKQRIARMYQAGSSKILLPRTYTPLKEAVLINTAGGITGGDKFEIKLNLTSSKIVATTQTAERLYNSIGSTAKVNIHLTIDKESTLHWLPQETIVFDGALIDRNIRVDMATASNVVFLETIIFGRQAMGEIVQSGEFKDNWRFYRDGTLFHSEVVSLKNDISQLLKECAGGNGTTSISTIIVAGKTTEYKKNKVMPLVDRFKSTFGISYWVEKLVLRMLNSDPSILRKEINVLLQELLEQPLPQVWQT